MSRQGGSGQFMLRQLAKTMVPASLRAKLREAEYHVQPLFYSGWSVECPVCGKKYREFLPSGRPLRHNALCRRCDSVERHRLLMLYLRTRTDLFEKPTRLLHFAPEPSFRKIFSALPNLRYVTCDYVERADVNLDITRLPFPDNTFDAILCTHVLEHIPEDGTAMRELYRVLKTQGWAILQVPIDLRRETYEDFSITDPVERRIHFGQEDHVRVYGRDYPDRLKAAGFDVTVDPFVRSFSPEQQRRYGLQADEDLYVCRKHAMAESEAAFSHADQRRA